MYISVFYSIGTNTQETGNTHFVAHYTFILIFYSLSLK